MSIDYKDLRRDAEGKTCPICLRYLLNDKFYDTGIRKCKVCYKAAQRAFYHVKKDIPTAPQDITEDAFLYVDKMCRK